MLILVTYFLGTYKDMEYIGITEEVPFTHPLRIVTAQHLESIMTILGTVQLSICHSVEVHTHHLQHPQFTRKCSVSPSLYVKNENIRAKYVFYFIISYNDVLNMFILQPLPCHFFALNLIQQLSITFVLAAAKFMTSNKK